jgi:hypothetical protein
MTIQNLVDTICKQLSREQTDFKKKAQQHNITSESLHESEKVQSELCAVATEIALEGLCGVEPKVLDKKETGYVAA